MAEEEHTVSINIEGESFKQQLISLINSSNIPISLAYYIIKDVFNNVEKTYYGILNTEAPTEYVNIGTEKVKVEDE